MRLIELRLLVDADLLQERRQGLAELVGTRGRRGSLVRAWCEPYAMVSVVTMLRRMIGAIKHAAKEENFAAIVGAAVALILVGTVTYSLGEGWNVIDGFYFAVCTLTTSSIADPNLTLTHEALKIFTAFYVLTGIGILVEVARATRRGVREATRRAERHQTRPARRETRPAPQGRPARDAGGVARGTWRPGAARVRWARSEIAGVFSSGIVTHLPRGGRGSRGSRSHSDRRP